ncbi:NlpC/P60 family protein [Nonomuraea sp. NPDC049152]|uniref:bifunctional WXG100 family type VII secretion target/C40 family peptidase n=1 Tax=Nonomuraea sp. NPDC049152 TaxID=3154350 RepID=UPI0033C83875
MTDWDSYLSDIQRIIDELSGNQGEISKISTRWRALAANVTTEIGALKRAVKTVDDAWNGSAAENFATHMAKYPASGTSLSTALTSCAGKLDAAGTALATAKGEVQAIYREKRAWLDKQGNDPDTTTTSMDSIWAEVKDGVDQAKGWKGRAVEAVNKATDEIDKHLRDVRFFTAITAPGDHDFVPAKGAGWVPDPDFRPRTGTTQLASYNGNGAQSGANGYGAPTGGNGGGGGGGGGGKPSLAVPPNAHSLAPNPRAQAVVDYALKQLGDPYVWGATGPNSFDCSGLTLRAYQSAGTNIPRVAHDQWLRGPRIPDGNVQAGDLIFFDNNGDGTADHVGIVLDPEKKTMIHAPNSHSVVRIESYATYPGRLGMTRPGMG